MIKNLTIGRRLALGFALLVILNAVGAGLFLTTLRGIKRDVSEITHKNLPSIGIVNKINEDTLRYRILTNRHILADNESELREVDQQCDEIAQTLLKTIKSYESYQSSDEARQLAARIEPALGAYREVAKRIRALSTQRKDKEAVALLKTEGAQTFAVFEAAVTACVAYNDKAVQATVADVEASTSRSFTTTLFLGIGSVAVAVVGGYLITRGINARLRRMADGLSEGAAQVASASSQVSSASQSLAEGSSEQASSLEETSSSLEEMASMTKRNSDSAQQAKALSNQARTSADAGATHMQTMRVAMDAIKTSSNDIAKIIKTIDEIAFQTNILALNAAVEAARAGEAGAGFAVVADEVRALAQRAANAAKETAGKIEDAIQKSDHGVAISASVASALADIVDKARKVDALVAEIATASNEQTQGIGQVNSAVSQMDRVTQSNAGNAEETAAAAEELNAQAQVMHDNVAELLRLIGGSGQARQAGLHFPQTQEPKATAPAGRERPVAAPRAATPRLAQPAEVPAPLLARGQQALAPVTSEAGEGGDFYRDS